MKKNFKTSYMSFTKNFNFSKNHGLRDPSSSHGRHLLTSLPGCCHHFTSMELSAFVWEQEEPEAFHEDAANKILQIMKSSGSKQLAQAVATIKQLNSLCRHGKQKSICKDCRGPSFCIHSRQKSRCKECGGTSICSHGRQKSNCRDCGGSSICGHGKRKSYCKDCGGSSICSHGRQKSQCKDCGGSSICGHGRQRSRCKECGGSAICSHGRQKSRCKECGGASICSHGRHKTQCKECGGSAICGHGKRKSYCKDCGGASICGHGRQKSQCKDCGGASICGHGRHKARCKDCKVPQPAAAAAAQAAEEERNSRPASLSRCPMAATEAVSGDAWTAAASPSKVPAKGPDPLSPLTDFPPGLPLSPPPPQPCFPQRALTPLTACRGAAGCAATTAARLVHEPPARLGPEPAVHMEPLPIFHPLPIAPASMISPS